MTERSKAEIFLIEQIRQGSEDGWSQLISRYHGRLLAFARSQLKDKSEADDVVQETFMGFLRNVESFRTQASLETFLFTILRRRLVDTFRRHGRRGEVNLCSLQDSVSDSSAIDYFQPESDDLSASQYVQRNESRELQQDVLWTALKAAISRLQKEQRFRDLQIIEMLFYAQLRNKEIGILLDINEKQVALVKHRLVKRLADDVSIDEQLADDMLLTRLWEQHRPSCPKRSTLGKWLMGTLDSEWDSYVAFHVDRLGCKFCQANREDLQADTQPVVSSSAHQRIMQSSIGFFRGNSGK